MTGKLGPINRDDRKVGYIYYHFSSRRNAWAWSYLQDDGSFWYAFGEGTTQIARRFDIRALREEIAKRLEEFPELAKKVDQYNQSVCLRLLADGRWKIVGTGIAPSIFNAETGERWQKFAKDEYIPVVHTNGAIWTVRNGVYYPSGSVSSREDPFGTMTPGLQAEREFAHVDDWACPIKGLAVPCPNRGRHTSDKTA